MKKRTTIADVAREAGVSMMTVSRAMNNKPGLSKELRQKIIEIAAELDYRPSKIARGLATRQMATIGLVVPAISNLDYAQIAQGAGDMAFEKGYNVFLINTNGDPAREDAALDSLSANEIDGAILCSLRLPLNNLITHIERFPAAVLFNRELKRPLPNTVTIRVNDQRAAADAVQHWIDQGRRRIAYIGAPENSFSSEGRLEGYSTALKNAGLDVDLNLVRRILPSIETGRECAGELLAAHPDVEAILAFNDLAAIGALQACQAAGKKVPEEVAIIGAGDSPMAALVRPRLSTWRVNLLHTGRLAMRTLLEILTGEASPAAYLIEPELILRESG